MTPEKTIPQLRVERQVDPNTGHATLKYFWNDKPIPAVELVGDHALRMSGLALIQKDLANALRWIDKAHQLVSTFPTAEGPYVRLENREVADDIKAFFVAALVFYAKAFTEATGRRAQMSRDWLDERFRAAHDHYMLYRHNIAAHSGDEKLELANSHLLLIPVSRRQVDIRVHTNRAQPDLTIDDSEDKSFRLLIGHAIEKVSERYNKMASRLIECASREGLRKWSEAAAACVPFDADPLVRQKKA